MNSGKRVTKSTISQNEICLLLRGFQTTLKLFANSEVGSLTEHLRYRNKLEISTSEFLHISKRLYKHHHFSSFVAGTKNNLPVETSWKGKTSVQAAIRTGYPNFSESEIEQACEDMVWGHVKDFLDRVLKKMCVEANEMIKKLLPNDLLIGSGPGNTVNVQVDFAYHIESLDKRWSYIIDAKKARMEARRIAVNCKFIDIPNDHISELDLPRPMYARYNDENRDGLLDGVDMESDSSDSEGPPQYVYFSEEDNESDHRLENIVGVESDNESDYELVNGFRRNWVSNMMLSNRYSFYPDYYSRKYGNIHSGKPRCCKEYIASFRALDGVDEEYISTNFSNADPLSDPLLFGIKLKFSHACCEGIQIYSDRARNLKNLKENIDQYENLKYLPQHLSNLFMDHSTRLFSPFESLKYLDKCSNIFDEILNEDFSEECEGQKQLDCRVEVMLNYHKEKNFFVPVPNFHQILNVMLTKDIMSFYRDRTKELITSVQQPLRNFLDMNDINLIRNYSFNHLYKEEKVCIILNAHTLVYEFCRFASYGPIWSKILKEHDLDFLICPRIFRRLNKDNNTEERRNEVGVLFGVDSDMLHFPLVFHSILHYHSYQDLIANNDYLLNSTRLSSSIFNKGFINNLCTRYQNRISESMLQRSKCHINILCIVYNSLGKIFLYLYRLSICIFGI